VVLGALPAALALLAGQATAGAPAAGQHVSLVVERSVVRDRVEEDGSGVRVVERSVWVRDPQAVAAFGQIGLAYIAGGGEVVFEETVVEKADGRRVAVSADGAEDLNPFGMSGATPADIRFRRLTIPGLEPGDRLHFRIAQKNRALYPGTVFGEWSFDIDPAIASEQVYELDLPSRAPITVHLRQGFPGTFETVAGAGGRVLRRLVRRATAPAAEEGPDAKAASGQPDVQYTTFLSWAQVGRWWFDLSRDRTRPDDSVRAEAARLVEGKATPLEKLAALHAFVASKVRYLGVSFGAGRMQPRPAPEVLASRYGDCKDKHALLAALAEASGIEVRPALVSSKARSLADEAPSPAQFDHVVSVALVGETPAEWAWVDSTTALAPAGYLLPSLRGKKTLLVDPRDGGRLVDSPRRLPYPTFFRSETKATLEPGGPLRAHVTWTVRGDTEVLLRTSALLLPSLPTEKRREIAKSLAQEWDKGKADNLAASEPMRVDEPLRLEYDVEHTMGASVFAKAWDLWLPLPDLGLPEAARDAGTDATAVELDLPDEMRTLGECRMPEGMQARPPLAVSLERPFASYRSTYSVESGVMRVERVLRIHSREVAGKDAASYEAFRRAVEQDRKQEFPIDAWARAAPDPAESASDLHSRGYAALDRGDAKEAEELLRKVTELDPKHAYAFNNLGRALRNQGRPKEALAAFDEQIEINPFDEYAWANRGDILLLEGKEEEAVRSFEKQIEVAPFRPWAYRSLGTLRAGQGRYDDAGDLLRRATSADPAHVPTWLLLAWTATRAGRADEALAAAERARSLDNSAITQVSAANAIEHEPYPVQAGLWAEAALSRLTDELDSLDRARMSVGDVGFTGALVESWRILGRARMEAGDLAGSERCLRAAWQWGLYPEAAVALARLREKQGRKREAIDTLALGAAIVGWRQANPAKSALEEAVADPAEREKLVERSKPRLLDLRTRPLHGPSPGNAALDVLLLVDARGRVAGVKAVKAANEKGLSPLRGRLVGLDLGLAWADGAAHPHVRRASVACSTASPCALVLDMIESWRRPLPTPAF
jgi:tetratricopeptide (TPR) repeat protein